MQQLRVELVDLIGQLSLEKKKRVYKKNSFTIGFGIGTTR
jgi:hypothetical protein